jgi:hypothetical protein
MAQEKVIQIRQPPGNRYPRASLLGLPRDIRNIIYDYCLPVSTVKRSLQSPCLPLFGAGLRRTCRQTYHETRDLSWTRGTLLLRNSSEGDIEYNSIRTKPVSQISRVLLQAKLPDSSVGSSMMSARISQRVESVLAAHLTPVDIVIQACTCALKSKNLGLYLSMMISLRDDVMALVNAWPGIEMVTFFYCDDSAPAEAPFSPALDSQFPGTWRGAFGQDARYFGPWNAEKKDESLDGEEGVWCLKHFDWRGHVTRTIGVDFFNVERVYGTKCALEA